MGFGVPMENRAAEHLESLAPCSRKDVHLSFSYFLGSIRQIGWISLPREERWDFLGVRGAGATWESSKVACCFLTFSLALAYPQRGRWPILGRCMSL